MKFDFVIPFNIFFYSWCNFAHSSSDDELLVEIKQGKLSGKKFESVWSKTEYYGFLGIPYAKPPIDDLRFQAPQPPDHWQGVYSATREANKCLELKPFRMNPDFEDCLYLNVYTPKPPRSIINSRKAVLVFIHGGGFNFGSASNKLYGADYLVVRDIILVTINYRLNVLGFLNLGLPECPGNVGLKDQAFALKWVKENIDKFGGDPDNVTIFGESAGASSVNYLILSPLSKGLFKRAIMDSGSALSPWAFNYHPTELAFRVGRSCGYRGNDTRELLQYLKKKSSKILTLASFDIFLAYKKTNPGRLMNIAPSIEVIKEGAFLPDHPENLAKTATPVPTIYGVNNKEGALFFMLTQDDNLPIFREDFSILIKNNFNVDPRSLPSVSEQIKQLYFGNKEIGMDNANGIVDVNITKHFNSENDFDIYFYYADKAIEFLVKSETPPYVYEFAHYSLFNPIIQYVNTLKKINIRGAAHGDEMVYLMRPHLLPTFLIPDPVRIKLMEKMTLMWTNFAKKGDPNPTGDVEWKQSTSSRPCYLLIKEHSQMMQGKFFNNRHEFLSRLIDPVMKPGSKAYDT